jgi:hypothetical protein
VIACSGRLTSLREEHTNPVEKKEKNSRKVSTTFKEMSKLMYL